MGRASRTYERLTAALLERGLKRDGQDYICPCHDDNKPSLGVALKNGKVLVKCQAGCATKDVLKAFGLKMSDLFDRRNGAQPTKRPAKRTQHLPSETQVARWAKALKGDRYWNRTRGISRSVIRDYEVGWDATARSSDGRVGAYTFLYRDADGRLVNVKRRWQAKGTHKKTFRLLFGRPTEFLWPPDQLDDRWVVLVEGEPDVLRAITLGVPAVTWPTGAGGATKAARRFAPLLEGKHVVISADSSTTGRKTAGQIADLLLPYAATVRIFDPFPDRNDDSDLSDWFDRFGNDVERFRAELRKLDVLTPDEFEMPSRDYLFPNDRFKPPRLGMAAEEAGRLRTGPGESLWRYENGVYRIDGDEWLAGYVRMVLREDFRANHLREVRAWCLANQDKIPTQPSKDYINVLNGLLYWRDDPPRLEAHSPDVPSIIQINAAWNPKADCPETIAFLQTVLPDDCLDFYFEWIGHLLIPDSRWLQRALMFEGPRDTGKSTALIQIETFLGETAVSHHTLQSICDDRFTAADLYGRLANIYADLDARNVANSGRLKAIVGGDMIQAERKFGQPFKFRPFARLMFSANEPPGTTDQSDAYYKRWLILPMHHQFNDSEQDPELERRLTTPDELSGLLNQAVAGLKRLIDRGRFAVPKSMRQAAAKYRANTDTVVAWGKERLEFERGERLRLGDAFQDYEQWCDTNNRRELGMQRFKSHVEQTFPRLRIGISKGYPVLVGARLRRDPDSKRVKHHVTTRRRPPKPED